MSGVATAIAGAAVVGYLASTSSADTAADAQSGAADQANATQNRQYNQTRADNEQARVTGDMARNSMATGLGLANGVSFRQAYADKLQDVRNANPGISPNWVPTDQSVHDYISKNPDKYQTNKNDPGFGAFNRKFSKADMDADPVYQNGLQFGLDQGVQGINRQAASRGGLNSGATLKALTRFSSDYGSTKANESYNRFTNDQNTGYNKLAGVAGTGQVATNQISAYGANAANHINENQLGAGNARASGYIANGNALTGMANTAANGVRQYSALSGGNQPAQDSFSGYGNYWNGGQYDSAGMYMSGSGGT